MKNVVLKIESNQPVGKDIYLMRLVGDLSNIKNPGEFVEIMVCFMWCEPDAICRRFHWNSQIIIPMSKSESSQMKMEVIT